MARKDCWTRRKLVRGGTLGYKASNDCEHAHEESGLLTVRPTLGGGGLDVQELDPSAPPPDSYRLHSGYPVDVLQREAVEAPVIHLHSRRRAEQTPEGCASSEVRPT